MLLLKSSNRWSSLVRSFIFAQQLQQRGKLYFHREIRIIIRIFSVVKSYLVNHYFVLLEQIYIFPKIYWKKMLKQLFNSSLLIKYHIHFALFLISIRTYTLIISGRVVTVASLCLWTATKKRKECRKQIVFTELSIFSDNVTNINDLNGNLLWLHLL